MPPRIFFHFRPSEIDSGAISVSSLQAIVIFYRCGRLPDISLDLSIMDARGARHGYVYSNLESR